MLLGCAGLGKTLLVKTIAETLDLEFARIEFTPDVMPADVTGTTVVVKIPASSSRDIVFRPGPIFNQLILADEISRATRASRPFSRRCRRGRSPPMVGTRPLPEPFFVLATPSRRAGGAYPLPEKARLDRFYQRSEGPGCRPRGSQRDTLQNHGSPRDARRRQLDWVSDRGRRLMRDAVIAACNMRRHRLTSCRRARILAVSSFRIRCVDTWNWASVPENLSVISAAKVLAVADGRFAASTEDIRRVTPGCGVRRRIGLTFEAGTDDRRGTDVVDMLLDEVRIDIRACPVGEGKGDLR